MKIFRQGKRERFALLNDESGFIATMAVVIMTAMMIGGLALLALNQRNNKSLVRDRQTQTAYSVAEAGLNNQIKLLSTNWPTSAALKWPSSCTQTSTSTDCPDPVTLNADFADTLAAYSNTTWTISVRDNVAALATDFQLAGMDAATTATCGIAPCTWDSNADGKMWVVAQAVLRDPTCVARQAAAPTGATGAVACQRERTLLAQAQMNWTLIELPINSVTAGRFKITNESNHTIIDTNGSSAQSAPVAVRCDTTPPDKNNDCLGWDTRKNQVSPPTIKTNQSSDPLVTTEELDMLRTAAKAYGTYWTTCPLSMAGAVVFVELASFDTCSYPGGYTYNSAASPGSYIISNGHVSLGGTTHFYGLIYALNDGVPKDEGVITMDGNATVQGALLCDGNCKITVGSTENALIFDQAALNSFKGVQSVVMGQNTFRDIPN